MKGYIGMATPDVGDIFAEEYKFNDFTIYHKDIKSTPLFGMGVGYDTGHYFRFDITGEYRGKSLFVAQDKYPGSNGFNVIGTDRSRPASSIPEPTNGPPTSRAGSACSIPISISAPGIASRPMSAAASALPRSRCSA